ncbi:hypothetical protein SJAV_01730 [Sulfurisphaera javensis]|uniref:SWIM-type domain-containing protein n=1 Tax=Sulfurisphaera javensis TaxID=2049879 RepID=A0AAT9GMV6_9CREN
MENYSKEVRDRASQLYLEGNVLGLIKKGRLLIGIVKDVDMYRAQYDLDSKKGKCECRLGEKCEHILAIQIAYEKGEYVNLDEIDEKIRNYNKREISWILLTLLEKFPIIANYLSPLEDIRGALARYKNIIKQNPTENIVNNFTDFLNNNKNKITKEDIFEILEAIVSCNTRCFYNFITEKEYDENLMKTLGSIFLEKEIEDKDIARLESIIEKDKYGNLDNLILFLFSNERIKNKLNVRAYLRVLLKRGEKDKILQLIDTDYFSKEEKFDILLQIDEKEAVEFAKFNMLYSKLFEYYYDNEEFSEALEYLKKMIELKDLGGILKDSDKIVSLIKGNNEIIKQLYELADNNVILYPLLIKLYEIATGSLRYDIAASIINKFTSLKDYYIDIVKITGEQRKDKLINILQFLVEQMVEDKKYEDIIQMLKIAKKYMKPDEYENFISQLKEKYKKRKQFYELINKHLT